MEITEEKRLNIEYVFFIFWIYSSLFKDIFSIFINPSIVALINYSILTVLTLVAFCLRKFIIKKKVLAFFLLYILLVMVNASVVDYSHFVYLEGFTSLAIFMLPVYLLSDENFKIEEMIGKWKKFAIYSLPIAVLLVILFSKHIIKYDVFDNLLLPNIIILSYFYYYKTVTKKLKIMLLIIAYILTLVLLGSRMSAIACIVILLFNKIWSKKKNFTKNIVVILSTVLIIMLVMQNLDSLIDSAIKISESLNLKSRTMYLLKEQINSGSMFNQLYLSDRESIYEVANNFIVDKGGLPGGFAVIPNLTNGKYYHAHNLFLQLGCFFGIIGCVVLCMLFTYKFYKLKCNADKNTFDFCFMLFVFYLIYSIANANFLTSFISIMCVGILFLKSFNIKSERLR